MTYPGPPVDPARDPFRTPGNDHPLPPSVSPAPQYAFVPGYATPIPPGLAQPVQQRTSPWLIALVIVSSITLIVGTVATAVGAYTIASSAGGWVGSYDDIVNSDAGGFGNAAEYGEYIGSSDFTGLTSIDGLGVGTCFTVSDLDDDVTGDPVVAACDQPHDYEVFATTSVGGGSYPGFDDVSVDVITTCEDKFSGYIGAAYGDSLADYGGVAPTERAWDDGERGMVCFAFRYDLRRSGSLRDSGE